MDADKANVIALIRLMVFHRICDPGSKLSCLRWLESTDVPGVPAVTNHQSLLRAMDFLIENLDRIERALAKLLLPLLDKDLTLAIHDLTTVRISGRGEVEGDIRKYGRSKDIGHSSRQFVLGMVQSQEGLPLMQQVHDGDVGEVTTLLTKFSEEQLELFDLLEVDRPKNIVKGG